jgi:hypothetical protein
MAQEDIEKPAITEKVSREIAFGIRADRCMWTIGI